MMAVRKCTVAELMACPTFAGLHQEYAADAAIAGLPPVDEKLATYRAIEGSGVFHVFGAFVDEELVGFAAVVAPIIPHYGATVAVSESLFVAKRHRKSGAGLALLRAAEAQARQVGSPALLVSAPVGGPLAEILPRLGYRETNRVFCRSLSDE